MELTPFNFWRKIEELHEKIRKIITETIDSLSPALPLDFEADFFPSANVYISDDYSTVIFSLPGVLPEDLDLNLEGNSLTVRGRFEIPAAGQPILQEIPKGNFIRRIELPYPPDESKQPEAELSDGLLIVRIRHARGGNR
jgi:HSP20 family protein